jgi:dienelactone hydrolase
MSLRQNELQITGSSKKLIALDITFDETKGKCPVVIYAHGFNGFKDWGNFDLIARQFVEEGFTFIKFNFSHNGTNPEQPQDFVDLEAFAENNYTKELFDLKQVIDWTADSANEYANHIQAGQIGLIGHSMGGGISIIQTAEDNRIKALVTWASISQCKTPWGNWPEDKMKAWKESGVQYYTNGRTKQEMPMHYQLYEDYVNHEERLDILKAASSMRIPFLICHGTEDTGVNIESAHTLHKANSDSALFIINSDHVFGRKHPWTGAALPAAMQQVVDKNIDFFKKHLFA